MPDDTFRADVTEVDEADVVTEDELTFDHPDFKSQLAQADHSLPSRCRVPGSLRGPDLAEVSRVRGPLPIVDAVDYIIRACEEVAAAHALGIVHRNLRPTTLVATHRADGTPAVRAFDFAVMEPIHGNPLGEGAGMLAGTSAVMSSLPYMAPEQIREPHDVDVRADVYALAAILHELVTAAPPFAADNAAALVAAIAADPPRRLREFRSDVPSDLDALVHACLAKNRAARVPSLARLVLALQPFASRSLHGSIARIAQCIDARAELVPALCQERDEASPPASFTTEAVHASPLPPPTGAALDLSTSDPHEPTIAPVTRSSPPPRASRRPARFATWATAVCGVAAVGYFATLHTRSENAAQKQRPEHHPASMGVVVRPLPPVQPARSTPPAEPAEPAVSTTVPASSVGSASIDASVAPLASTVAVTFSAVGSEPPRRGSAKRQRAQLAPTPRAPRELFSEPD